jgi:hypothetical protein
MENKRLDSTCDSQTRVDSWNPRSNIPAMKLNTTERISLVNKVRG